MYPDLKVLFVNKLYELAERDAPDSIKGNQLRLQSWIEDRLSLLAEKLYRDKFPDKV